MPTLPEIINRVEGKEYSVARLSKDNLCSLAILHSEVYSIARGDDYFLKKYDTAYTSLENVGFIAYNNVNQPVAYYGVIPCFIQFENEIVQAAQSADTMTHPQHRNKGLFVKLSNMTFDLCRELGIRLIFGFPNQNSYPTMIGKLHWTETEKMNRFMIPVNKFWVKKLFGHSKRYLRDTLNRIRLPQAGISNSVTGDGFGGVYRNDAYLHYKAFSNTYVLKLRSSDIWIKTGKELVIGDIILKGRDDDFFEEITELAGQLQLNKISFQVCRGCRLHDLFASRYKAIPSFPVLFKDFGSGLPLEKIKFTFADFDIF